VALTNLSFETQESDYPGLAQAWSLTIVSVVTIAGYALGGPRERAWETFEEGWITGYSFELGSTATAEYAAEVYVTPPTYEDFLAGWSEPLNVGLGATTQAEYGVGLDNYDDFLSGWTTALATDLDATTSAGADDFLTGWLTFVTSLPATSPASYGVMGGTEFFEDFEDALAPVPFVPAPGVGPTLTSPSHGLSNDRRVQLRSTGRLPDGFGAGNYYFIVGATAGTFELAASLGGTGITPSSTGSGTHYVVPDGASDWELTTLV
jgi:hypothetical protein